MRGVAALALAGVVALGAGCDNPSSTDDAEASASATESAGNVTSPSGSVDTSDFATFPPERIAGAAKADMYRRLENVRYVGQITSGGRSIELDLQAGTSGCQGTIGIGGGTAELRVLDGSNWIRADAAFWRATLGDLADPAIAEIGEKWALGGAQDLSLLCNIHEFFGATFMDARGSSTYRSIGTSTLDGQEVAGIEQSGPDGTADIYVRVESEHFVLKIVRTAGNEPGSVRFSDFDKEFHVDPPDPADVVDLSALG